MEFEHRVDGLRNRFKQQWYRTHDRWGRPRGPGQPYNNRYNNPGESIELEGFSEEPINVEPHDSSVFSETSISESTPLLETAADIAPAAVGGASNAAVAAAGAVIGVTGVTGATYAILKSANDPPPEDNQGGYNLPGHKYIGPGNKLDRGTPVDEDDIIAQEHDQAYENAKSVGDVQKADDKAFNDFLTDWIENGNVHSLIGAIGIKGKAYVEKLTGHLYPDITGTSIK